DVRYAGQGHEIRVDLPDGPLGAHSVPIIRATFERVYASLFGRTGPEVPLEAVSWRLLAAGPRPSVALRAPRTASSGDVRAALKRERPAYFPEWQELRPVAVYDRYQLPAGVAF